MQWCTCLSARPAAAATWRCCHRARTALPYLVPSAAAAVLLLSTTGALCLQTARPAAALLGRCHLLPLAVPLRPLLWPATASTTAAAAPARHSLQMLPLQASALHQEATYCHSAADTCSSRLLLLRLSAPSLDPAASCRALQGQVRVLGAPRTSAWVLGASGPSPGRVQRACRGRS